jgi:hypothetical protein
MGYKKTLVVTSITPSSEVSTGDILYAVSFGTYIDATDEIRRRIQPSLVALQLVGNKIPVSELVLFVKGEQVPYKIGSKWNLSINDDGSLNVVEQK